MNDVESTDSLDSLGEYFRKAREAQGLTIEQVAATTRIQESYLQALEEERFQALPEKVFTKGFVRTYARTLGLDEEEALRRFAISAGTYYQKEEEEQQQVLQREEETRRSKTNRNAVIILTGVILIGLFFLLPKEQSPPPSSGPAKESKAPSVSNSQSQRVEPEKKATDETQAIIPADAQSTQGPASAKSLQDVTTPKPSSSRPEVTTQTATRVSPPAVPSSGEDQEVGREAGATKPPTRMAAPFEPGRGEQDGPLMLEMEALEITWVVVRSDDRPPHEALLQPGDRALWRAHERFILTLGNAGGVKVTLNGQPLGPFGKAGEVIRDLEIRP